MTPGRPPVAGLAPGATELPAIPGERVMLRALSERDVPALFTVFGDSEVTRYWAKPALVDEAAAAALLADVRERFRARTTFQWGIARREDDALLGTCSLYGLAFEHRRSEIGFALGRAHWGHGYATAALQLAIAHAFGVLGLEKLEADVDPRNAASLRTLTRLGFIQEGYLRARYHVNGEVQDSVMLGLVSADWPPSAPAP